MAGFFDKLKQGAAEAGKKAQVTVEVNRLKMQISTKGKEIQQLYATIGEAIYKQVDQGQSETIPEACLEMAREIDQKRVEVAQIQEKIHELKNEVLCSSCGQVNERGTNFCSGCGSKIVVAETDGQIEMADAPSAELETESVKCPACGHEASPDKKFCGNCGQPFAE